MIDFYYSPTPNGWKVAIMLEECGLDYRTHLLRLGEGDQFKEEYLKIAKSDLGRIVVLFTPIRKYNRGIYPVDHDMTAVTDILIFSLKLY